MEPIETSTMSNALQLLAKCESLKPEVADACLQAAKLLRTMREIIITSDSEDATVTRLKFLLAQQGDG
jgi:hypothetical protein